MANIATALLNTTTTTNELIICTHSHDEQLLFDIRIAIYTYIYTQPPNNNNKNLSYTHHSTPTHIHTYTPPPPPNNKTTHKNFFVFLIRVHKSAATEIYSSFIILFVQDLTTLSEFIYLCCIDWSNPPLGNRWFACYHNAPPHTYILRVQAKKELGGEKERNFEKIK